MEGHLSDSESREKFTHSHFSPPLAPFFFPMILRQLRGTKGDERHGVGRGGGVTEGEIFRALMVLIMMMLLLLPKLSSFMLPAIKVKILWSLFEMVEQWNSYVIAGKVSRKSSMRQFLTCAIDIGAQQLR